MDIIFYVVVLPGVLSVLIYFFLLFLRSFERYENKRHQEELHKIRQEIKLIDKDSGDSGG